MKKLFLLLLSIFAINLSAEPNTITIGIAPHSSSRVILESHQDLRVFFENYFKRPVEIITAKNFSEYADRSNQGTFYDLIVTSPNLAVIAQQKASYLPIMTYTKGLTSVIIAKDKEILKSKKFPLKIIGLDPVSFTTLTAEDWLEEQGFHENKEISYTYSSASDSAAAILLNDNADMAIMSLPNYLKLDEETKQKVSLIYQSAPKPSRIYLAKEGNGITLEQWKKALDEFSKSSEGTNHLTVTKLEGYRMLLPNELNNLDKIVNKTLKRLND
jgi:phosphonate transport system substrate-binding protein